MNTELLEFLADESKRKWKWGETDCSMTICRWVQIRTGIFPAQNLFKTYKTRLEAECILETHDGLLEFATKLAKEAGLQETDDPLTGDIGVITPRAGAEDVLAVRTGSLWCARALHGLSAGICEHKKAWRVP